MSKGKWNLIFRKKKADFIFIKLPLKFKLFFDRISDKDPQYCFVCGFYIPFSQRNTEEIKKPTKKSEPCHTTCFNLNIKFENIHEKLNENSALICRIDKGSVTSKQPICRNRVLNNANSIMYHITQKHPGWSEEFSCVEPGSEYNEFRKNHFLKPDGRNFLR